MAIGKVIFVAVGILVICLIMAAMLPDILLTWYETDMSGMAFGENPDKVGRLGWTLMPFFGLVILGVACIVAVRNAL